MKKFKKLLIVAGLLMALGLIVPAVQGSTNTNDGFRVASDWPPQDSVGSLI